MSQPDEYEEYETLDQEEIESYEEVLEKSLIGKVFNTFDRIIDFIIK